MHRILLYEAHQVLDAGACRVGVRLGNPARVEVDADATHAEPLGGRNDDPAITAPKVIDYVVFGDAGQIEHPVDNVLWCRDVGRETG